MAIRTYLRPRPNGGVRTVQVGLAAGPRPARLYEPRLNGVPAPSSWPHQLSRGDLGRLPRLVAGGPLLKAQQDVAQLDAVVVLQLARLADRRVVDPRPLRR